MKTYRVGVIGLGRMGSYIDDQFRDSPLMVLPFSIAACTEASDRLELVAGADILQDRREGFAERWGVKAVYDDYEEMIKQEKPDIVAVCTTSTGLPKPGRKAPTPDYHEDAHADISERAAEMGVPMLFIEKAIACSVAAADRVLEACRKHGTVVNTGVVRRFDNRYQVLRDIVARGDIGEPLGAVSFGQTNLMHGHIHSVDTVSYLLGDPKIAEVRGELQPRDLKIENNRLDEDPKATFELAFANGMGGWNVPAGGSEVEVLGTEGSVRSLNNGAGAEWRKAAGDGGRSAPWESVPVPPVPLKSSVVSLLEDLVDSYEAGRPSIGNIEVTHHITEAVLAVAESHKRGGAWVSLPLEERDTYIFHV